MAISRACAPDRHQQRFGATSGATSARWHDSHGRVGGSGTHGTLQSLLRAPVRQGAARGQGRPECARLVPGTPAHAEVARVYLCESVLYVCSPRHAPPASHCGAAACLGEVSALLLDCAVAAGTSLAPCALLHAVSTRVSLCRAEQPDLQGCLARADGVDAPPPRRRR
jgi:hypothetical protein